MDIVNTDVRATRTKQTIKIVCLKLLKEKSIEKITVSEICTLAKIHRSTFYNHYQDVYDLFDEVISDTETSLGQQLHEPSNTYKSFEETKNLIKNIIIFIQNNPELVLLQDAQKNSVLGNSLYNQVKDRIANSFDIYPPEDYRHYTTAFAMGGIIRSVKIWFKNGQKTDVDEFADFITRLYFWGSVKIKESECSEMLEKKEGEIDG